MSNQSPHKPTLIQVIFSVLAAMFGVQSGKVRERDFSHGSPAAFIVIGIIAVTLFVCVVYFGVKLIVFYAKVA